MPALDREDVAHLARLSRLKLTDSELDHYGEQLDVILGAVARVAEVAADAQHLHLVAEQLREAAHDG